MNNHFFKTKILQMKNLITLTAIVLLSFSYGFSQDKGYIGIAVGPSIPTGDFASKDMNNESAGFAKTGAIFDITFAYKLNKNFGVTALLRGQANKLDAQAVSNEMSKQMPPEFSNTVRTGSWGIGGLLVGGYSTIPIAKQLSFESKLMLGFISATSPDVTINLSGYGETAWVKQNSVSSTAFAYMAGIGLKYDAGKRVCVLLNVDYLGSNPKFDNVETTSSDGEMSKDSYSQAFGTVNFGFGVGYRL